MKTYSELSQQQAPIQPRSADSDTSEVSSPCRSCRRRSMGGTGYGDPKQSRCPQDRRYCQQPGVGLAFQCQVDDEQASYQHQTCRKQESDDGAGRLLPGVSTSAAER